MTSIDIPLYGDDIEVLIDWDGDASFDHARSDVSDDWLRASFQFGTSRRSNPQRPTIQAGTGSLVLIGEQYVPGRSTVWTLAQLRQRYRVRVSLGAVVLWECWMDRPKHPVAQNRAGFATSFELEGYLERPGRVRQMIAQTSASVNANATAVLDLLSNAYGLGASDFAADIDATPLSLYSFDGPAAQYASQFALVAGGLPCARRGGGLRLQDPGNRPQTIPTFRNTEYAVLRATTDFDVEQLFNVLTSVYPGNVMQEEAAAVTPESNRGSGTPPANQLRMLYNSGDYPITLTIPAPPQNQKILSGRFRLRMKSGQYRVVSSRSVGRPNPESLYDVYINGAVQSDGSLTGSVASRFPTGPYTPPNHSGTATQPTIRWLSTQPNAVPSGWESVTYEVTAEYTLQVPNQAPVTVDNAGSVAVWEPRTLAIPGWIAETATTSFQARIDELSEPRNIIVEDFAVRQPTAQRTTDVANIQPGDHVGLITSEPSDRVNINAVAMVMNVGYDLHREREVSRKRLVCIEAGARVPDTFPPTFVSASTNAAGTEIVAVFDEKLDASSVPALSAFTIRAGTTRRLGSARSISGSEVKFAFGTAFAHVDVITIAYTKPDSDPLQDEAGNEVETFTAQPVTNNVSEPITGDGAPIRALGSLSRGLSRDRYGDGDPIAVALTLDEARWALTVLAEAEPIAVAAALEDATGAALLEAGDGEPIDATAALNDAGGNVLTFGRGSPIVAATTLEDDAAGTVIYLGTGEPIAASGTLEDATGDELLETGSGKPIDATAGLPDASGRDIKPYPAPENARERTRIPFGRLFQVTFEWDAPTSPPRQGDLWQYEYQTRAGGGNWSSSSTVGSTTLVSGSSTFTENEEYDFRVRAVYVFNAQFFRSDWATYSSNVEPTSGAGEPISISAALPEARERGPVTGLPPYALTLNDRALALNDHVLTLPPPSV